MDKYTLRRIENCHRNMISRCYNDKNISFKTYGARNIVVCDEWKESKESFILWALHSGYGNELTLERKDVHGNYTPSNCTWISRQENNTLNKKNSIPQIIYKGKILTVTKLSFKVKVPLPYLRNKIDSGEKIEDIINSYKDGKKLYFDETTDGYTVDIENFKPDINGNIKPLFKYSEECEKRYIIEVIKHFKGNMSKAAIALQVDRKTLYNKALYQTYVQKNTQNVFD